MNRIHAQLGIAGALLLPAAAVALTTPNLFSNGDVLSASDLNENFSAIEAEVNALRSDVTALQSALDSKASSGAVISLQSSVDQKASAASVAALESDVGELAGSALTGCVWQWEACDTDTTATECRADCPSGKHVVAGGCDNEPGHGVTEIRPIPQDSAPFPSPGASFTDYDTVFCRVAAAGEIQAAFALCCSNGI
jgi:hypothetical protein